VWLDHQDDYEQLLGSLSQSNKTSSAKAKAGKTVETAEAAASQIEEEKCNLKSLEQRSMQSKARVHYTKFTRSKDLSNATSNDLNCILGHKKRIQLQEEENGADSIAAPVNENESEEDDEDGASFRPSFKINEEPKSVASNGSKPAETHLSGMFNTNKMSIGDYFKQKMMDKNNPGKKTESATMFEFSENCERESGDEQTEIKIKKKKKKSKQQDEDVVEQVVDEEVSVEPMVATEEEEVSRKKKKKKSKKTDLEDDGQCRNGHEDALTEEVVEEESAKKKKKSKKNGVDTEASNNGHTETITSVSIDAIQTTRAVVEQDPDSEMRVKELDLGQLESKIKESFPGSNLTSILGYSSYVINSSMEEQLREKARKAHRKRIGVEKMLEIAANFYTMAKKKKC
jgi:Pin2-interacting protein X1